MFSYSDSSSKVNEFDFEILASSNEGIFQEDNIL